MPQRLDTDAVDREAFLRTIIDRPEDDLPRLIYADWLDERGDPRGRLIRLQTEWADPSCPPLRRRRLAAAEKKLLKRFHAQWAESLGLAAHDVLFRRGFAEVICGTTQSISSAADRLLAAEPVRVIRLVSHFDDHEFASKFASHPLSSRIEALDLGLCHFGYSSAFLEVLLSSPHWSRLRTLDLTFLPIGFIPPTGMDDEDIGRLAANPAFGRLESLILAGQSIGEAGVSALCASPHLHSLKELILTAATVTPAGLASLRERFGEVLRP